MDVSTDGTIHPEEAVKQASRILIQHLMIITDENITFDSKEDKKEDVVDEQMLQLRKVLKTPLEDLDLSVRAFNCLKAAKINSLSELVQYEQEDLMKFRNFGQTIHGRIFHCRITSFMSCTRERFRRSTILKVLSTNSTTSSILVLML